MYAVEARNINDAFILGLAKLRMCGTLEDSRNGPVLVLPAPLATVYHHSRERVLFEVARDGNPFFHLFESLWMLAGSQDLEFLLRFNKKMADYSDDGKTVRGSAYGYRWRHHFNDLDQLRWVTELLKKDPTTRRAVLAMWDAREDLGIDSKDIPCNTHVYFRIRRDQFRGTVLDMTVCCRSNDMIYGGYGSNVVHFSILQEFIACSLGIEAGKYTQISNNAHVYTQNPVWQRCSSLRVIPQDDSYRSGSVKPFPLFVHPTYAGIFLEDCKDLVTKGVFSPLTEFFADVVLPLYKSHAAYKQKDFDEALHQLAYCKASDWKLAASLWYAMRGVKTNG